jgi:DNA-binding transcriptional regulator LsrR (DeoR family)
MEQTVWAWHDGGHSQRAIARELGIDRRKVKRIIDQAVCQAELVALDQST